MAVYFIECARRIKIGFTTNLPKRVKALKTGAAHKLKVIGAVDADRSLERSLHKELADHRTEGEWFKKNQAVMSAVERTLASLPPAPEPVVKPFVYNKPPVLDGAPYEPGDTTTEQIDRLIAEFAPSMNELKAFCVERMPAIKALPEEKKEIVKDAYDAAKDKYFAEFWPCAARANYERQVAEEAIARKCAKAKAIIQEVLSA